MNKTAIKNFAIWARNKLIADIQYRAGLMGITADGVKDPLPQSTGTMEFYDIGTTEPYAISGEAIPQRKKLVEVIRRKEKDSNYATAYKYILEEVAYTWFNRLIAIRFMEVNDYLPSHIRVLSSESGKIEPDLVTTPFDAELAFTSAEEETVLWLKTENKLDELFRLLFIKQCNALNEILPALFEKTNDYTELLLNLSVVDQEGVVYHLIHDIDEDDFNIEKGGQVEIIGWLYQFYNIEPFNELYEGNQATEKINQNDIPAATQLFTPDWIVRYMIENSLGRIFIDKRKEQGVYADGRGLEETTWDEVEAKRIANEEEIAGQMGWKYYLPEAAQTRDVRQQLDEIQKQSEYKDVRDIKVIDPCMGSGHILVYAFDVLMQMYENDGYSQRDAAQCILEHNLFGLDIDERAAQLAYFAVMMKARQYDRRIFSRGIQPHVYAIAESNDIDTFTRDYFTSNDPKLKSALDSIMNDLCDAKEYGSILTVSPVDFAALYARIDEVLNDISLYRESALNTLLPLVRVAEVMAQKYDVICTNPPYLNANRMDAKLTSFLAKNYKESKQDMSMVVYHATMANMLKKNAYIAFITPTSWMFSDKFKSIRELIINTLQFMSLVDCGTELFDGKVGHLYIGAWVSRKISPIATARFVNLTEFCYSRRDEKLTEFFNEKNQGFFDQSKFKLLPESPIAYSVSLKTLNYFSSDSILDYFGVARQGLTTSDNNRFLRTWQEVRFEEIGFGLTDCSETIDCDTIWYPYFKGGNYQKWYPRKELVVNYYHNGEAIKNAVMQKYTYLKTPGFVVKNTDWYFKSGITWNDVGGDRFSARFTPQGFIFADASPSFFPNDMNTWEYLGYFNSCVFQHFADVVCQGLHYSTGQIPKIPYIKLQQDISEKIVDLAKKCYQIVCDDFTAFETDWDFTKHPFVRSAISLSSAYSQWENECNKRFNLLRAYEEDLNSTFIEVYGFNDELKSKVEDKDITVHRADLQRDAKSLLSYAVGCMFGRYSLDVDGLAYAGGDWDDAKYKAFHPDRDGILPITDEEYLEDDIIARLCDWLKAVYGADTLEENLDFISGALGGKGNSSREIIRSYFLKEFFKDHCKTYQKRPIYWLFDSGKQNGFKALIYLHRYTPDTIGNLRVDYLHKMQRVYESEINRMQDMIDHSTNAREVATSTKRKEKLQKQLKECRDYDEMIAHLALSRIELDLDDGVKVNYEKIQTASDGKKYAVLAKI